MTEDNDFISFYKKRLEDFKPSPPIDSWEEIEKQLDIDDVWQNIANDLDQNDRSYQIFNISRISEVAILFALLLWLLVFDPAVRSSYDQLFTAIQIESAKGIQKKENMLPDRFEEYHELKDTKGSLDTIIMIKGQSKDITFDNYLDKNHIAEVTGKDDTFNQQWNEKGSVREEVKVKESTYERKIKVSSKDGDSNNRSVQLQPSLSLVDHAKGRYGKIPYNLAYLQPSKLILPFSNTLLKRDIKRLGRLPSPASAESDDIASKICFTETDSIFHRAGFSFGISASIKNHWLLNNTTYRGLSSEELTTTLPSFGKNFGILMAYDISSRTVLQTEFVYSEEGQSYKDYIGGKYQKETNALTYFSLSALVKYRLHSIFAMSNAASSNLLLGVYFGKLQKAAEILEENTRDISREYKDFDTGLFIGYEYEYKVFKSFTVTPGMRFKYGLTNIYSGDGMLPASMNSTKNGSLDLNIALKYNFSSK